MKNDIADILFKYTTGEATLEETNDALKEAEAGFNLEPGRNEITPDEMALTTVGDTPEEANGFGLLDTGTGSMEKVHVTNGKLDEAINQVNHDGTTNMLAFVIIGPKPVGQLDKLPRTAPVPGHTGADKTSMLFTLPDKSGALSGVLSLLAEHKINMRKLESRPLRGQCWKYVFFTDVECDLTAPQYEDLLRKLAETCTSFRILGSYATGPQLDRIGLDDVEDSHA